MMNDKLEKYKTLLESLGKRPRIVLEKILQNGSVSTYELGQLGYDQPPRAAQDLKEHGVALTVTYGKHPTTGNRMAIYSLDIDNPLKYGGFEGRKAFPKKFREELLSLFRHRCNICNMEYPDTILQLDHRIPYLVEGEPEKLKDSEFQLLCGSHQRLKSWACEHCRNRHDQLPNVCRTCYWAFPDGKYEHIATNPERRVDVTWQGETEIREFNELELLAERHSIDIHTLLKTMARELIRK